MFENIGKKIKSLANILCWVGIIAYVIAAIVMISTDEYLIGTGFLLLIVGPLMSWVGSLFIYGFGELIDKTCDIAENTRSRDIKQSTSSEKIQSSGYSLSKLANEKTNNSGSWACKECGTKNDANSLCCKDCGKYK